MVCSSVFKSGIFNNLSISCLVYRDFSGTSICGILILNSAVYPFSIKKYRIVRTPLRIAENCGIPYISVFQKQDKIFIECTVNVAKQCLFRITILFYDIVDCLIIPQCVLTQISCSAIFNKFFIACYITLFSFRFNFHFQFTSTHKIPPKK